MNEIRLELQSLLEEINQLNERVYLRTQNHADAEAREDLTVLYNRLKDKLEERHDELKRMERKNELSEAELAFLVPAIMESFFELRVKRGAMPSAKMSTCLAGAASYISYHLSGLGT